MHGQHAGDTVRVVFHAACPRNNVRQESTFLKVQRQGEGGTWDTILTDSHLDTKFRWWRPWKLSPSSLAAVEWVVGSDTPAGTYRMQYYGDAKSFLGSISEVSGTSHDFAVAPGSSGVGAQLAQRTQCERAVAELSLE